jgi:hypothetical protein
MACAQGQSWPFVLRVAFCAGLFMNYALSTWLTNELRPWLRASH